MIKLTNVCKSFGGVKALEQVDLEVYKGEIHAILGENGAGKSTLMKVISGAHKLDAGSIEFEGRALDNNSPQLAQALGINIIYQEFSLVPELTVAENMYFGRNKSSWLDWKALETKAKKLIDSLGFDVDVTKKVHEISVAQQQMTEIAKALSNDVKLLILDEPSAVLGPQEIKKLFALLKKLKSEGVSIIYISHHLDELLELTDRVTILKDGKTITTVETREMDKDKLINYMIGRELKQLYPIKSSEVQFGSPLEINGLQLVFSKSKIDFEVKQGEILGIGGLVGSGRTEMLQSLFGMFGKDAGFARWSDVQLQFHHPRYMIKQGWGMVPEDRKRTGGVLPLSINDNISLSNLGKVANFWGIIDQKKEAQNAQLLIEKMKIKLGKPTDSLSTLSGGNQQKVILAKWLNLNLNVLLVDEPTRGVDVGARYEIYKIIQDLADSGVYIILVSSDMEELMGMSDRIMVMKSGNVQGIIDRTNFQEETILRMAIGAN